MIVATPTPLHAAQGPACIGRGLPTLIEKPLAVTCAEARPLMEAARGAWVALATGHHRRRNPLIARARGMILGGAGRVAHPACWPREPDAHFAEAPWRTRAGAGPISVALVHDVDTLRHLCGEVVSVQAQAAPSARGHENEDGAAAILRLEAGVLATMTVSDAVASPWSWEMISGEHPVHPRPPVSCLQIGGSEGHLSVPDLTLWRHRGDGGWWSPMSGEGAARPSADPLEARIAQFAQVIRGREAPLVSGEEGLRTPRAIEAIQSAAATGGTVALEPQASSPGGAASPTGRRAQPRAVAAAAEDRRPPQSPW